MIKQLKWVDGKTLCDLGFADAWNRMQS